MGLGECKSDYYHNLLIAIDVERAIRMGLIQQQDENSMSSRLRVPLITDETIA